MQIFPPPAIKSFERLQVTEGLLITPAHWQGTQSYHRQRQNFQFQSLYQPGIVSGLGVTVTVADDSIESRYRDGRWVKIQAGIAIDAVGNPIVVPQPELFQITARPAQPEVVYLAINYVDPEKLRYPPEQVTIPETYRIIQKTALDDLDVELCRIVLTAQDPDLKITDDVHQPALNTLDHRYRLPVKLRPQKTVRIGCISGAEAFSAPIERGYNNLLQATESLYPTLQGSCHQLHSASSNSLDAYNLIACAHSQINDLVQLGPQLKQYLRAGGVLCIHANSADTRLEELQAIRQELLLARANLDSFDHSLPVSNQLEAPLLSEIESTESEIAHSIQQQCQPVFQLAAQIDYPLAGSGQLRPDHPLLSTPFLFAQPPTVNQQPVHVFCWGNIVLMVSNIVNAWALDQRLTLSRNTIRTAQEWGINLLHFAWRCHHLTQLQVDPSDSDIMEGGLND